MEKSYTIASVIFWLTLLLASIIWFYTLRNEAVAEKVYTDFYKENKGQIKITGGLDKFRDIYYFSDDDPKKDNDHIQDMLQACHNAIYGHPTKLGCNSNFTSSMSLNNIIKNFLEPDKYDSHKYYLWCLLEELDEKYCFCHTNTWARACKWYTRKN
jgi:hypothetical protein